MRGLSFGAVLSLIVTPVVYAIFFNIQEPTHAPQVLKFPRSVIDYFRVQLPRRQIVANQGKFK
jgi:hypothetical protein